MATTIKFKNGQLDKLLATDGTAPAYQEGTLYFADNSGNTTGSGRIYLDTKDSSNNNVRILVGAGDALLTTGATQATTSQTVYLIGAQTANANHAQTLASRIKVIGTTIYGTAENATKDSAGQQINTTYIKGLSVSGQTITYTKGDGTTGTITTQDTNTTYGVATTSANGLMSSSDKSKLNGIATGAEVNQNAFSNVIVGSTTIAADAKTDSLTLVGSNVTLTPDATNDKITIGITKANVTSALGYTPPTTNTTYSEATTSAAGLMSASDKSKLNGIAAGAQVNTITGVKGNAEASYRTGNVNITPANVGAVASSEKGAASGVVPLNSSSLIDSKYLPSYVDDVLEYASKDKFPSTGEAGKIYVDTSVQENNTYRWSGSTYILIAKNTNTTYKLTKSGSTITLTGNDGSTTSVADSNTTYSNATTSAAGLMSAADKSKLDGIASGANAYTLPAATSSALGGVKIGSNITNASGTISLTKDNVTSALGYTPPTTNTTYSTGTATTSGLTKLYTGTGTATDGTMTQSAINTALSGKAASNHNHDSTYLKLSGGTVTGIISRSAGGSWISARNNVVVNGTATGSESYNPVVGQKTPKGHWAIGNLGSNEYLTFVYSTDTNYSAGTNSTTNITLPTTGGTIALTSQIPSVGNGTITITQGGTTKGTFTMNQSGNTTIALTDNNTTYSAGTGISLSGTTFSNSGVRSIASGSANGTISVNTNGTSADVAVKGLGSAAYTASTAYATASHNHDSTYLKLSGGTMTGDILFSDVGTGTRQIRFAAGSNDYARIAAGATATNAGYLEIATADDTNEPIYVRQYSGVFSSLTRTATLLDGSGNTSFPNTVSGNKFTVGGGVTLTYDSTNKCLNFVFA